MVKFNKPMTAAEALKILQSDPEWVAMMTQKEEERQKREAKLREAQAPLLRDLRAAGYELGSVSDLVNTSTPYPDALPILLKHLHRPYPSVIREFIARALAVRPARFAWKTLVKLFKEEQEERAKDGLAVALAAIADEDLIGEVASLARDTTLGSSRIFLLRALSRSKSAQAHEALLELDFDPVLHVEVQNLLRSRKRSKRKGRTRQ